MTRHPLSKRLSLVAAMALLLAAPSISFAQVAGTSGGAGGSSGSSSTSTGNIGIQILTIGGQSQDDNRTIWLNLDACVDDAEVTFRIDQFPSGKQLDVYVGTDCNLTTARDGEGTECDLVLGGESLPGTQDQRLSLTVGDIVNLALGTDDCGAQKSTPSLWFLAVDASESGEEVGTNFFGEEKLNIDTDPPDAPVEITGGRGENEIPVSWDVGNENVDSFEIYVDSGNGMAPMRDGSVEPDPPDNTDDEDGGAEPAPAPGQSNDMCGTGALVAGQSADNVASLLKKSEGSATATSTTLSSGNIDGEVAAVAVVALDEAGNKSPLSEVQCVYVVPTTGFKDLYEQENGELPQGCPCAAAGPAQLEGALPIALALGLIAYRRRRRS